MPLRDRHFTVESVRGASGITATSTGIDARLCTVRLKCTDEETLTYKVRVSNIQGLAEAINHEWLSIRPESDASRPIQGFDSTVDERTLERIFRNINEGCVVVGKIYKPRTLICFRLARSEQPTPTFALYRRQAQLNHQRGRRNTH